MAEAVLSTEFLRPEELRELAGSAGGEAQCAALDMLGVPYRRVNRRVLVSRYHVREWLSGRAVTPSRGVNLALVK